MNLILNKLPNTISTVYGDLDIKTDYREWLKIESYLSNSELSNSKKLVKILELVDMGNLEDIDERGLSSIVDGLLSFYNLNEALEDLKPRKVNKQVFSFDEDSNAILTDFYKEYNIELESADLHWFKFRLLFNELSEESKCKKIMMFRSITINSKMTPEQKQYYLLMKKRYKLKKENKQKNSNSSVLASSLFK